MPDFSMSVCNAARPSGRTNSATTPGLMNPPSLSVTGTDSIVVTLANPPKSTVAPIDSYDLQYSTDDVSWTVVQGIADPETLAGLPAGTTHQVQTRAVNVNGPGPWSTSATATTATAATVPAGFGAADWSLQDDGDGGGVGVVVVTLPADGGSPITDLEYQVDGGAWQSLGGSTAGTYHFTWGTTGTAISVAIRAVNAVGAGSAASAKSVTPTDPATVPGTMSAPAVTAVGSDSISVDRAAAPADGGSPILSYDLRHSIDGTIWTLLSGISDPQLVAGLASDTTYLVQTRAVNAVGQGGWSASASATTASAATAPAQMGAPEVSVVSETELSVSRAAAPADGGSAILSYDLRYSVDEAAWTVVAGIAEPQPIGGLSGGTSYFVQTRAVNAVGAGPWSDSTSATTATGASAPAQMAAPAVTSLSETELSVDRAAAPADGGSPILRYDLRHSTDEVVWTLVQDIAATAEIVSGLATGSTYAVQTRAVNAVDDDPQNWSASTSATTGTALPTLSGSIANQTYRRGVAIVDLDLSTAFSGQVDAYAMSANSDALPSGLSLDAATGILNGVPLEASLPGQPFFIEIEAINSGGTSAEALTFSILVEQIELTDVTISSTTISFATDEPNGTVYWSSGDTEPTEADLIAGTGAGIDLAGGFAVDALGGSAEIDLSAYVGATKTIAFMQVSDSGEWSALLSTTETVQAARPAAFADSDWNVATGAATNALDIAIAALPADRGSAITDVEYDVDGAGVWTPLPSFAGAGSYTIAMAAAGTPYGIRLRAINANGAGDPSNTETATSGVAVVAPAIVSSAGSNSSSAGEVTSFAATMPGGIAAGNKLVAMVASDGAPTMTASGWTWIGQAAQFGAASLAVFQKTAVGGDAMTVSLGNAEYVAVQVVQIEGVDTVEAGFAAGTSANPDPPSLTLASGTRDAVALAAIGHDSGTVSTSAVPSTYTRIGSENVAGAGLGAGAGVAVASRTISAASTNPGPFTISGTEQWVAATIVAYKA